MLAVAMVISSLLVPSDRDPPNGWICQVSRGLGSEQLVLTQSVDAPGHGFATSVELRTVIPKAGHEMQWFSWMLDKGQDLSRPSSLYVAVPLRRREARGSIKFEYDGNTSIIAVSSRTLSKPIRGRAAITVVDRPLLASLWNAKSWRVSVVDRQGLSRATVETALPLRAKVEAAYVELRIELAAQVAAPSDRCGEAGPEI